MAAYDITRIQLVNIFGRDKMATISQTTFSNAFSGLKIYEFQLTFHWSYSQGSNEQYSSIGSDNGLTPSRWQAIISTNDGWFIDAYMRHSVSRSYSYGPQEWRLWQKLYFKYISRLTGRELLLNNHLEVFISFLLVISHQIMAWHRKNISSTTAMEIVGT